jgi:hypothetical protein
MARRNHVLARPNVYHPPDAIGYLRRLRFNALGARSLCAERRSAGTASSRLEVRADRGPATSFRKYPDVATVRKYFGILSASSPAENLHLLSWSLVD